jgi:hypothetical protein
VFGLFNPNSVTGLVVSTLRDYDSGALFITLRRDDGDITLQVGGELSMEIERLLITRKQRKQATTLTLVYDPDTFAVTSYSVIS